MMKGFRIDRNDGRIYAMGVTAVSGGVHFSFPSKGETCAVILYRKGAKSPKGRIEFPVNARTGDVWSMTVLGDFSGLEYVYEVDGQQMPDPYGRKFTGMERWGSLARRTSRSARRWIQKGARTTGRMISYPASLMTSV